MGWWLRAQLLLLDTRQALMLRILSRSLIASSARRGPLLPHAAPFTSLADPVGAATFIGNAAVPALLLLLLLLPQPLPLLPLQFPLSRSVLLELLRRQMLLLRRCRRAVVAVDPAAHSSVLLRRKCRQSEGPAASASTSASAARISTASAARTRATRLAEGPAAAAVLPACRTRDCRTPSYTSQKRVNATAANRCCWRQRRLPATAGAAVSVVRRRGAAVRLLLVLVRL